MEVNPYQPPVVAAPTLADEQHARDRPAPRPIGIWFLSGLHLLVGLLFLAGALLFLRRLIAEDVNRFDLPFWFVVLVCGLMAVLGLASSIGLWLGARWGWWLAAFYYVWGVLGTVTDFLHALSRMEAVDVASLAEMLPIMPITLALHMLIVLYLFKRTVRDFFRLKWGMLRSLTLLAIIASLVLAATIGAAYLQASGRA